MVLLIGNYLGDRQQSMQRFATMMLQGLTAAEIPATLLAPIPRLGNFRMFGSFVAKWLGYLDKFVIFPLTIKRQTKFRPNLVHICDHSNAMYRRWTGDAPVLVTCHDLLAVRGALGEVPDCPASTTGKILQRWILWGLRRATRIACVSEATRQDVRRLLADSALAASTEVVPLGLGYAYRPLPAAETAARLRQLPGLDFARPFLLHVGSNEPRKNRAGALRILQRCAARWDGQLIFAGDPLTSALRAEAKELGVADRICEVQHPPDEFLEALYNQAFAFLFPSRFEGFGWPVIEAQSCACPVIASNAGPLPEVAGDGAQLCDPSDEAGFADAILKLTDPLARERWQARSLANAARFSTSRMIAQYVEIYRELLPQLPGPIPASAS